MPKKSTIKRARRAKRAGKSPSTQAGEFVREEIEHVREGKHGARSTKQAIAIGLNMARRAGVDLPPPKNASQATKRAARSAAKRAGKPVSRKRSVAAHEALESEASVAASHTALSRHAKRVARERGPVARSKSAKKAARTRAHTMA